MSIFVGVTLIFCWIHEAEGGSTSHSCNDSSTFYNQLPYYAPDPYTDQLRQQAEERAAAERAQAEAEAARLEQQKQDRLERQREAKRQETLRDTEARKLTSKALRRSEDFLSKLDSNEFPKASKPQQVTPDGFLVENPASDDNGSGGSSNEFPKPAKRQQVSPDGFLVENPSNPPGSPAKGNKVDSDGFLMEKPDQAGGNSSAEKPQNASQPKGQISDSDAALFPLDSKSSPKSEYQREYEYLRKNGELPDDATAIARMTDEQYKIEYNSLEKQGKAPGQRAKYPELNPSTPEGIQKTLKSLSDSAADMQNGGKSRRTRYITVAPANL